ncbi:uncharacterized protein Tsen54 [Cherax quadricarinatus]
MTSSQFTSGKELLSARSRDQTLPVMGEKLTEASGSEFENNQAASRLSEHHKLLAEPKFTRRDQLAIGEWLAESRMVRVAHETGKFWQYMGAETDIGKCLYPEEALYLIDTGELEVQFGGIPLSVQQAQMIMLQDPHHLDQYYVYAHLSRCGCKVVRHQTHLVFSRYEKQIRLDKHQLSKKGPKLNLKVKESSNNNQKNVKLDGTKEEFLDDAMKVFYATLGKTAENSCRLEKNEVVNLSDTEKLTSGRKKRSFEDKEKHKHEEEFSPYEKKRRELLDMLPTMFREKVKIVHVEQKELLPANSIPHKELYEINLEGLNYYSLYDDTPHRWQNNSEKKFNNWKRKRNWGEERWKKPNMHSWQPHDNVSHSRNWQQDCDNFRSQWERESWKNKKIRNNDNYEREGQWDNSEDKGIMNRHDRDYGRESQKFGHYERREQQWQQSDNWRACPSCYDDCQGNVCHRNVQSGCQDAFYHVGSNEKGYNGPNECVIDYTKTPEWKTRRRRWKKNEVPLYPSYMVRLHTKVHSWKEYKKIVSEMSAEKLLANGPCRILWNGHTTPLIKPAKTTSTKSLLSACSIIDENQDISTDIKKLPQESHLMVHYDVYLPTVPYKKSNPGMPSKRITVMRERCMPSPGQILEVSTRFHDDVPVVSAVVVCGEVRLYTLTPLSLPQPNHSR